MHATTLAFYLSIVSFWVKCPLLTCGNCLEQAVSLHSRSLQSAYGYFVRSRVSLCFFLRAFWEKRGSQDLEDV
uniref:Putative secreted protein n=1 Tax=Amblyomma cajennense TaxID=34607 RepID=A0A023FB53_AMBCJ